MQPHSVPPLFMPNTTYQYCRPLGGAVAPHQSSMNRLCFFCPPSSWSDAVLLCKLPQAAGAEAGFSLAVTLCSRCSLLIGRTLEGVFSGKGRGRTGEVGSEGGRDLYVAVAFDRILLHWLEVEYEALLSFHLGPHCCR